MHSSCGKSDGDKNHHDASDEGLTEYAKRSTLGDRAAAVEFLCKLEDIVNKQILGDKIHDFQWICPVSDNKMEVGQITMPNVRTQKIVKNIDLLLMLGVPNKQRRAKWRSCICIDYHGMLELLLSHSNLTPEQIKTFQLKADAFFEKWVELWGDEGISNYIYMIFYFRRTQRGGGSGNNTKSRLVPITKWVQRRMVWMSSKMDFDDINEIVKKDLEEEEVDEE
ncbi:hypothetical protein ACA910_021502 [Epithemia clementina (nom. ined.)]